MFIFLWDHFAFTILYSFSFGACFAVFLLWLQFHSGLVLPSLSYVHVLRDRYCVLFSMLIFIRDRLRRYFPISSFGTGFAFAFLCSVSFGTGFAVPFLYSCSFGNCFASISYVHFHSGPVPPFISYVQCLRGQFRRYFCVFVFFFIFEECKNSAVQVYAPQTFGFRSRNEQTIILEKTIAEIIPVSVRRCDYFRKLKCRMFSSFRFGL